MASPPWLRGPTLGCGSTATVSLALPLPSSRSDATAAAVKSSDLSASSLLQREQRILSRLRSKHVVSYLGFDVTAERGRTMYNLFLEYAPGGSIADEIQRRGGGGLDEWRVRSLTRGILLGLSYLHSLGLAHCDVKGRNVLIGSDGEAKIADFGCARWVAEEDALLPVFGTPAFMAPEVARGEEQGTEADIWSLGCTVIEMATGRPPWPEATDAISAVRRIAFSDDVPELPSCLSDEASDFLGNCFRRDAADRWTAEELLRHPFVAAAAKGDDESLQQLESAKMDWRSPKCVLDQSLWDEEGEESDDEEEMTATADGRREESDPSVRISQLAGADDALSASWGLRTDDDDWIVVREGVSDCSTSSMAVDVEEDRRRSLASAAGGFIKENTLPSVGAIKVEELVVGTFSSGLESYFLSDCDSLDCFDCSCKLELGGSKKRHCFCYLCSSHGYGLQQIIVFMNYHDHNTRTNDVDFFFFSFLSSNGSSTLLCRRCCCCCFNNLSRIAVVIILRHNQREGSRQLCSRNWAVFAFVCCLA